MPLFRQPLSLRQAASGALCALSLAGCALRGNVDVLESELHKQELAQEQLADELAQARNELKIARSDAAALRTQLAEHHQVALSPEQADVLYRAEAIKFNMLLTSGQDRDKEPGDEGLSVLLTPVDAHGDLVKLAGEVVLELFDMTLAPDQQRLGEWKFTIDEVREHWHRGFLSAGYLFQVDWQSLPAAPDLTLHARLTVPDGRQFDATTQIKVAPPGSQAPAVARDSKPEPGAPPSTRKGTARPDRRVVPAAGKATLRKVAPPAGTGETLESPVPQIRPVEGAGHALPTRTSDVWTEATIPTLR